MLSDETLSRRQHHPDANPGCSRGELALELGRSLGKVKYCFWMLVNKGLVKARNVNHFGASTETSIRI